MTYCWKCGSELQAGVSYCGKCGSPVHNPHVTGNQTVRSTMAGTGFEQLSLKKETQDLWLRRVVAFIIDAIVIGIAALIIDFAIAVPFFVLNRPTFDLGLVWFWGLTPLLIVAYFIIAEAGWGKTVGKELMGLRSVRVDGGPLDIGASFVRNISKINWVLVLLDVLVGLVMQGDGRQKFTDRLGRTMVVSTRESSQILR